MSEDDDSKMISLQKELHEALDNLFLNDTEVDSIELAKVMKQVTHNFLDRETEIIVETKVGIPDSKPNDRTLSLDVTIERRWKE